jgi:hypothetical protein
VLLGEELDWLVFRGVWGGADGFSGALIWPWAGAEDREGGQGRP